MAALRRLYREQLLEASLDELWSFLCDPGNLNLITPPDLDFEIVGDPPAAMYNGLMIEYRVRVPVLGRTSWLTEIKHVEEGCRFVDEQRVGPYALWIHRHELIARDDGVLMVDDIRYRVPGWIVEPLVHALLVGPKLERIFTYRREYLAQRFTTSTAAVAAVSC